MSPKWWVDGSMAWRRSYPTIGARRFWSTSGRRGAYRASPVFPCLGDSTQIFPTERFCAAVDQRGRALLEVVTEFHKREAMPWSNWHVGNASDVARIMDVGGYPTYLLVDGQGRDSGAKGELERYGSCPRSMTPFSVPERSPKYRLRRRPHPAIPEFVASFRRLYA